MLQACLNKLFRIIGRHFRTRGIIINENGFIIKIFEKIEASFKRVEMSKTEYIMRKLDLLEEYQFPKPLPPDMLLKMPKPSDHAYLVLGQKGTGQVQ